jgi:hypothetical protein
VLEVSSWRERVRGAEGKILGAGVRWLAEREVSSAKNEVKEKATLIDQLKLQDA